MVTPAHMGGNDPHLADIGNVTKFCGACGASIDPMNRFCPSCGQPVTASSPNNDPVGSPPEDHPLDPITAAKASDTAFFKAIAFIVLVIAAGSALVFGIQALSNGSVTSAIVQGPAKDLNDEVKEQVASDAAKEYALIPENDKMSRCVHAQATAEAYLQAQDNENYSHWHLTQGLDCAIAGVPQ